MKTPLLIVNPHSGPKRTIPSLGKLLAAVEETLGDVVVHYTTHRGHAQELAADGAREGHSLIVAVGGDGTFNEVANGVLQQSSLDDPGAVGPTVALIDAGTGGDFRRSLGIGSGYEDCLAAISLGRERLVDVGLASFTGNDGAPVTHYFVNVLSAGLSGVVVRYVEAAPSFLGGRAAYYLSSLRGVMQGRERRLSARVTWGETEQERVIPTYLVAICNGGWFGGGMNVAPMALPDDGRLEVITVTGHSRMHLAAMLNKSYSGRHMEEPTVEHFPCTKIELSPAEDTTGGPFLLEIDGDPLGALPLTVEILPRRLRIRA